MADVVTRFPARYVKLRELLNLLEMSFGSRYQVEVIDFTLENTFGQISLKLKTGDA
jgi:hypothetical protein